MLNLLFNAEGEPLQNITQADMGIAVELTAQTTT